MLVTVVLVVTAVVTAVWAYSRYRHNYWASRGVPTAPGVKPLVGHTPKLLSTKHPRWLFIDEVYRHHGGSRICGLYEQFNPVLLVGDPDLVKTLLIKDFDHFVDRKKVRLTTDRDEIFNQLVNRATGEHWKALRAMLSPIFTSGKLKGMFPLVEAKADALKEYIRVKTKSQSSVSLKQAFNLYSLEVISSCAFGMETNSMNVEDTVFNQMVQKMFKPSKELILKLMLFRLLPRLCEALRINYTQPEMEFFKEVVGEAMKQREKGLKRGDFLDLMMEARDEQAKEPSKASKYPMKDSTVVANSILFILAGYETTAITLCFVAFELARHPKEQQRVRQELQSIIKEHGALTYQDIMEANFLDAFVSETLRMHPPANFIERQCTRQYKVPGFDLIISPGTMINFPVWSLHRDPRIWSDPEVFSLDRFLPHNRDKIKNGTYLPFGLGPRNCMGMRFALMETKIALTKILLNFELSCVPGRDQLEFKARFGHMRPGEDWSLNFTPLK